jgi:hypothetical protein
MTSAIDKARAQRHMGDAIDVRVERISKLVALCSLAFLGATFGANRAQAQDAPAAPAPTTPSEPGAAPPAEPNPPSTPGAAAFPSEPSPSNSASPAPATPVPDVAPSDSAPPGAAAPTGSAAFEPLPDSVPKHKKPHPRAAPVASAPEAAPASPPPAEAPAYHQSTPRSSDPVPPPESDKANDDEGLFGPFRIGVLVGGGLPDLLTLGGMIKLTRYFGAGVNVGLIPTVKISLYGDATVAFQEYDLYGHIFPFGGAFFMGAGVGYANVHGTIANRYTLSTMGTPSEYAVAMAEGYRGSPTLEVDSQANVRTLVLTPQIGLLKTFQAGFSIGIDVGAQVPIAPSKVDFATTVPPGLPAPVVSSVTSADAKVRSTLTSIGRTVLPTVGVKIGWLL